MAKGYLLTEEDRQTLKAMLERERIRPRSRNRPYVEDAIGTTPEVYIMLSPSGGIPALDPTDDTPGSAECDIYQIDDATGLLESIEDTQTVYNLSLFDIPAGEWVTVVRDKFGSWIASSNATEFVESINAYRPWASGTTYAIGDRTSYSGTNWTSLTSGNIANTPTEGVNWTGKPLTSAQNIVVTDSYGSALTIAHTGAPAWSAVVNYKEGWGVTSAGNTYRALTNNLNSTPASNPTDWLNVTAQGVLILNVPVAASGITSFGTDATHNDLWVNGSVGEVPNAATGVRGIVKASGSQVFGIGPTFVSGLQINNNVTVNAIGFAIQADTIGNATPGFPVVAGALQSQGVSGVGQPVTLMSAFRSLSAITTLNGGINNSTTSVTVTSGTNIFVGMVILIGSESMNVTGVAGAALTVTRGYFSTTAASHSNGDIVYSGDNPSAFLGLYPPFNSIGQTLLVLSGVASRPGSTNDTQPSLAVFNGTNLKIGAWTTNAIGDIFCGGLFVTGGGMSGIFSSGTPPGIGDITGSLGEPPFAGGSTGLLDMVTRIANAVAGLLGTNIP